MLKLKLVLHLSLFNIFFSIATNAQTTDKECINWFNNSKIKPGTKDCELKCSSLLTDMATFTCPDQCELLCKSKGETTIVGRLLYYPGLTPDEKKLVEKYPKDALIVFIQKEIAERSTNRNFPEQNLNDESDAFRHFMWAGLLTKKLGKTKAKEFLDAHENNRLQDISDKNMDIWNNNKGMGISEKLTYANKWNLKNLESEALKALKEKKLKVLTPRLKIPEVPK